MVRLFLVLFFVMGLVSAASAQNAADVPVESAAPSSAPSSAPSATNEAAADVQPLGYDDLLLKGHHLYLSGDQEGALTTYAQALSGKPGDPLASYFTGCAQAKLNRNEEALKTFQQVAATVDPKSAGTAVKALFMAAVVTEASKEDGAAVKTAWRAYKDFAARHPDVAAFQGSADARIAAFEKMRELDEQYKVVRERIAGGE